MKILDNRPMVRFLLYLLAAAFLLEIVLHLAVGEGVSYSFPERVAQCAVMWAAAFDLGRRVAARWRRREIEQLQRLARQHDRPD